MSLYNDVRPNMLDEVYGNHATLKALNGFIAKPPKSRPHAYLFQGASGCIRGDTLIFDPIDNSNLTVKERWKIGHSFNIFSFSSFGKMVVARALPPVQYPSTPMFRVDTSQSTFYVTSEHRFLFESGEYLSLKELFGKRFEQFPLLSIEDVSHAVQHRDEPHYLQRVIDSQGDYPEGFCFCDEQFRCLTNIGREFFLLLIGALEHNHHYLHEDALGNELKRNRPYLLSSPLSRNGFSSRVSFFFPLLMFLFCKGNVEWFLYQPEIFSLIFLGLFLANKDEKSHYLDSSLVLKDILLNPFSFDKFPLAFSSPFINSDVVTSSTIIKNITEVVKEEYYDFQVPIFNNYWAGGLIHHNCGKTTLARILAHEYECADIDLIELNAANTRGIDTIREITDMARIKPMGGKSRVFIIDESHQLTKPAQQAFLKIIEDAPLHSYFMFCSTDPEMILITIRNRCTKLTVDSLSDEDMTDLIEDIIDSDFVENDISDEVFDKIVYSSEGSPRQAIVSLEGVLAIDNEKDQIKFIERGNVEREVIDLCRILLRRPQWSEITEIYKSINKIEPEKVRRQIIGYMRTVLLGGGKMAGRAALIISIFEENTFDGGSAQLVRMLYDGFIGMKGV